MNELIISKKDLIYNINLIKKMEKKDYNIIAVVKGNGYGLDVLQYTKVLKENGINFFAVASFQEIKELMENKFDSKLMLLTPYSSENELEYLIKNDIVLTIDNIDLANKVNELAKKLKKKVKAHIKIDTGLKRYGFDYKESEQIKEMIENFKNIEFEGIYSHFSYSLGADSTWSKIQYNRFTKLIEELNVEFKYKHICNSSGYFKYKDMHLNTTRIGSAFLGQATGIETKLKRIGKFKTKITRIKEVSKGEYVGYANTYKAKKNIKIAILPTGYFDGVGLEHMDLRFSFKSRCKGILNSIKKYMNKNSYLIVNGEKTKLIGQLGMNDVVIDITNKNYKVNDEVIIDVRPIMIDSKIKRKYE